MKVSLKWLSALVNIKDLKPEEIADKLTFAGVEVEDIIYLSSATNLVIGKVLYCEAVEGTHLHITKVDMGQKYGITQIVCGAKNVRKGLRVIVAREGANLPMGKISKTTIKGIESNGMLCSLKEIGMDEKYMSKEQLEGIEEVNENIEVGQENVLELFGLDDVILDMKLLANRCDLNAMKNVAYEVSTLFNREVYFNYKTIENDEEFVFKVDSLSEKCPTFLARVIKNISIKDSSPIIKEYLRNMGIRSINNIVDIGNYIMLLTGQPVHMYDFDKLNKKELIVKDDLDTTFVALDGNSYQVKPGDIAITSDDKIMCLGGIMGSGLCEIDEFTKNIVVEVANFNFASIRRTSVRLNLTSESSIRFTKGIDPNQGNKVLDLLSLEVKKSCLSAKVCNINTYDVFDHRPLSIKASVSKINNILGLQLTKKQILDILIKDHIEISNIEDDFFVATIPSFRLDFYGVNDLAEEVIRIVGFDSIITSLPVTEISVGSLTEVQKRKKIGREFLLNKGLSQVQTYVLVSEKLTKDFTIINKNEAYKLLNPMTEDREFVRTGLLPSLLNCANYNFNHQNKEFSFFEMSDIDSYNYKSKHLGIILMGNNSLWGNIETEQYDFYHMKGLIVNLFSVFGVDEKRYTIKRLEDNVYMHPGKSAGIYLNKKLLGYFGNLHPNKAKEYSLDKANIVVLELDYTAFAEMRTSANKFKTISRFPRIEKDYNFILDKNQDYSEVLTLIKKEGRTIINDCYLIDIYEG